MQTLQDKLVELWKDVKALEAAYRTCKISFYQPIGKQALATAALAKASVVLVLGSNRSGKSVWGVAEAIAHSLGVRPWLDPSHPDYIVRLADGQAIPVPNTGRVIAQNYGQAIVQTIWPKFQEWAPAGQYKVIKNNQRIPIRIEWTNGSVIHLMSNEQDDMAFEGTNGHWVWADEPIDYSKYIGLKRGLVDFNGHMWMTMTPLTQWWIHSVLVSRANEPNSAVKMLKFSIWDNCTENGGFLKRESIMEFLADLREEELEARLHGRFMHMAGRVFKEWEPAAPYWMPAQPIPDTWPRVCIIDPHPRKPIAVVWLAITPDDRVIVYRDLYDRNLKTVSQVSARIKELEGWIWDESIPGRGRWYRGAKADPVAIRIIDTSSKQNEPTSGDSIFNRFASEGLLCALAKKQNYDAGIDAIHDALAESKFEWGEPGLVVYDNCLHVKQNFLNFIWDDWTTSKQKDRMEQKQSVLKSNDDMIDGIRYYYQHGLSYKQLTYSAQREDRTKEDISDFGMSMTTGKANSCPMSSKSSRLRDSHSRVMGYSSTGNLSVR